MRKLLLFIFSLAMLVGGLYLVGGEVLTATSINIRLIGAGGFLALLGAYLLWVDFAAPRLGIKTGEE